MVAIFQLQIVGIVCKHLYDIDRAERLMYFIQLQSAGKRKKKLRNNKSPDKSKIENLIHLFYLRV